MPHIFIILRPKRNVALDSIRQIIGAHYLALAYSPVFVYEFSDELHDGIVGSGQSVKDKRTPLASCQSTMSSSLTAQTSHLASRLASTTAKRKDDCLSDDEQDEEDIFAELEAEIEEESGAGAAMMREYGMTALKQE